DQPGQGLRSDLASRRGGGGLPRDGRAPRDQGAVAPMNGLRRQHQRRIARAELKRVAATVMLVSVLAGACAHRSPVGSRSGSDTTLAASSTVTTSVLSRKWMKQVADAERSSDRRRNAHAHGKAHTAADPYRGRTRHAGALGPPTDERPRPRRARA